MKTINCKLKTTNSVRRRRTTGIAALPVMLLLGGIIIEAAIAGAFILYYVNSGVYGTKLATQSSILAHAAVDDAIFRIILNPNCGNDTSCLGTGTPFTFTAGGGNAQVTIEKDTPSSGLTQITATAETLGKEHRVVAIVTTSSTAPLVTIRSIIDQPEQ